MTTHLIGSFAGSTRTQGRASRLVAELAAAWRRWSRRRRAAETLYSLPDYYLKDLGISRSEIEGAVRGDFNRGRL